LGTSAGRCLSRAARALAAQGSGEENALAEHPGVLDVAVVSKHSEACGETIVTVATSAQGTTITLEDLGALARDLIADHKLARDVVVREIPLNPSGKLPRHMLRSELRAPAPVQP
ncbi:MAG: AMP-binding enzyme, partial [Candidatus Dormibacteria bacterium]